MRQRIEETSSRVYFYALIGAFFFAPLSIRYTNISLGLAAAAWILLVISGRRTVRLKHPFLWPVTGFIIVSAIAVSNAVDIPRSLDDIKDLYQPFIIFLFSFRVKENKDRAFLLIALALGMSLSSAAASAQYFKDSVLQDFQQPRARGVLSIYMTYAGILLIVQLLLGAVVYHARSRVMKLLYLPLAVFFMIMFLFTYVRSAWLGFAVGVCALLGVRAPKKLGYLLILMVVFYFVAPGKVGERMRFTFKKDDWSSHDRLAIWWSGWQIIKAHPLTGVGPDNVQVVYPDYVHPDVLSDKTRKRILHLHNNILQIWAERGPGGLLMFLWLMFQGLKVPWDLHRARPGSFSSDLCMGIMIAVLGFNVMGMFEFNFGDSEVIMLVWMLLGILPYTEKDKIRIEKEHKL